MKILQKITVLVIVPAILQGYLFASQFFCSSTEEIQSAMQTVQPGDSIIISGGEYIGSDAGSGNLKACFYSGINGLASEPIVMMSADTSNRAKLCGEDIHNDYVLYITGNYWKVMDIDITTGRKGIMLDNAYNVEISKVNVYDIGEEGIHIRDGSSYCRVSGCKISNTGRLNPHYGEGIYVGSARSNWDNYNEYHSHTEITKCIIGPNVTAESIDIKEGTFATIVDSCTFQGEGISGENYADSFIDVKGNYNLITNCFGDRMGNENILDAIQTHQIVDGFGIDNLIHNNKFHLDSSGAYLLNASSGSAVVYDNQRIPEGNMYKGNYSGTPNFSPFIRVIRHLVNPTYATNDSIIIPFFALDLDGEVKRLEFYWNGLKISEDDTEPFEFISNSLEVGKHYIHAKAIDSQNNFTLSDTIEIEVLAESTDFYKIPIDSTRVSASADDGNIAVNTIDGDLNTRWSAEGDGQWLEFDLKQAYNLSSVKIAFYKGNQRVTYFDIETSADGVNWEKSIANGESSGLTNNLERFPLQNNNARYVKYIGHRNSSNDWNSLTEVEIWSSDSATTDIEKMRIPENFSLNQNYPNPFNSMTTITFEMTEREHIKLQIFDIHGRLVDILVEDERTAGYHSYQWDATGYSSGIYFCKLTTNNYSNMIKMIYLK